MQLKILGTTTGLLSRSVEIRIGNPYIAFVVSIALAIGILFLLAWLVERWTDTKPSKAWTLSRLFLGLDGEPSLSLFQMYMWTGLVVAGMVYGLLHVGRPAQHLRAGADPPGLGRP